MQVLEIKTYNYQTKSSTDETSANCGIVMGSFFFFGEDLHDWCFIFGCFFEWRAR
jgi:hypothetical protein